MGASRDRERNVVAWLLEGDPAIRWQAMRDLVGEPDAVWGPVQAQVATEGWGAQLLTHQDASGRWTPRLYGYKWISTTYSMVLLWQMGLPAGHPGAVRACGLFLDEGLWGDGGVNLSATQRRSETCQTGMVLGLLSWFGVDDNRRERLVEYLLTHQMSDGGWNCEWDRGATHSSFEGEHGSGQSGWSLGSGPDGRPESVSPGASMSAAVGGRVAKSNTAHSVWVRG